MMKTIRVGTRKSLLALVQTQLVTDKIRELFPDINIELVTMSTKGDERLDKSLASFGGKGVFTKELEEGLLSGAIDIAVHSAKDMPMELPEGLTIGAVPGRADVHDLLVVRKNDGRIAADERAIKGADVLSGLPEGFRIGTGSLRRELQLLDVNSGLCVAPIRGNVQTRLNKLADGGYDGIILAKAGITRLMQYRHEADTFDYQRFSYYELDTDVMLPAAGQGILAVEARAGAGCAGTAGVSSKSTGTTGQAGVAGARGQCAVDDAGTDVRHMEDSDINAVLAAINDENAQIMLAAERAFLNAIGGSCNAPAAALSQLHGSKITMTAMFAPDGAGAKKLTQRQDVSCAARLGADLARLLLERG